MAERLGTIYVEMDLDYSKFEKGQQKILTDAKQTSLSVEKNWKTLGEKSDIIYQAMANGAINAFNMIANKAGTSAAEQFRAQSVMVAKINALNQQQAKNPLYETLGVRSVAAINEQKAAIISSYDTIKKSGTATAQDLINIEAAKNAKIIALDNELNAVSIANAAARKAANEAANADNSDWWMRKISTDRKMMQMETEAFKENEARKKAVTDKNNSDNAEWWNRKISNDRKMLNLEAEAWKENESRKAQDAARPWETLGIKSSKYYDEQKKSAADAYESIKRSSSSTADDISRAERAKNEKLKALNKEMVGDHEMSMASMTRALLRFYAAYYVVSSAIRVGYQGIMSGIKAIDDLKLSTIAVASQIATMQGPENVAENYRKALIYSEQLNKKLMEIDASSYANYQQIQLMNRAMNLQGVLLDANNAKQVESFTALTNAVAMFTQGQDKEKQASQEIRALFSGQVKAGNMLALQMDAQIRKQNEYRDGLKGLIAEGEKHGDTLERMMPYLTGIVAASGDIQQTWEAVSSSVSTAWGIMERAVFKDIYKNMTKAGREAAEWMKANAESIADSIRTVYDTLMFGIKATTAVLAVFTATTVASLIKAGDASAWFALRWEAMSVRVTLATSKMTLGFGVFVAAVAGWSAGELLNKFESVREAGVMMVYGLAASWNWFITKAKEAGEVMGTFFEILGNPTNFKAIIAESAKRMELIRDEYEKKKKFNDEYRAEQLKAVSDAARAEAKAKAEAGVEVPVIPKGTETDDEAIKAARETADRKLEIEKRFQNEYDLIIKDGLFKKLEQLRQGYEAQKAEAEKYGADITLLEKRYQIERDQVIQEAAAASLKNSIDNARKAGEERIRELRQQQEAELELERETAKFIEEIKAIGKDTYQGESFGDSMAQGINNAVIAMQKLNDMYDDQAAAVKKLADARKKADAMAVGTLKERMEREKALAEVTKREGEIPLENTKAQMSAYRSMFGTIGELFDENSKERKAMHSLEMAFAAAEIAINIQKAITSAVSAIANQGSGDPYSAFGRIAAMTALMAGVLSMAGVSFGGGGSGGGSRPVSLPPSTVLGAEPGTASESIANAWELLKDTYDMEYRELSSLNNSMRELNQNITGLVTSIVRTGGVSNMNLSLGTELGGAEKAFRSFMDLSAIGWGATADILNDLTFGISGWVDDLIGSFVNSVFGGKTKKTLLASGIELGQITAEALLEGGSMSAKQYAYIKKKKDGGWFGSDKTKYYYQYADLDDNIEQQFTAVFRGISETMMTLSVALGTDVDKALEYVFDLSRINLQGMTTEEINTAITDFFSTESDKAAEALFGDLLSGYQQINEGLFETAVRMITWKEVVLETLEMTNQSFSGSMPELLAFSDAVVNLAGDLEAFTDAAATYYDKFFDDAEKQARLEQQLTDAMGDLNKTLPGTRAGYRAIIEALDLTTTAGQMAYVQMLNMAGAADEYYSALEEAAEEAANGTDSLIESLESLSKTISEWLADLNVSDLSPVSSAEAWMSQYTSMKTAATAPGAEASTVTDFLNFATQYLQFMKSYGTGGSYKDIYDAVVADVMRMQAGVVAQIPAHASGGLTNGLSFAGEAGREWVVPTYEPQRRNFLRDVGADPETIGKVIAQAITQSNGGSTGGDIQISIQIDGREIGRAVAKEMRTNSDLQKSVRSLN